MSKDLEQVIVKAIELSHLIQKHPATVRFEEARELMQKDVKSQQLLDRLISLGKILNEKAIAGEEAFIEENEEMMELKIQLEKNSLVKSFISSQKEYLGLIHTLIEKINNPDEK